jgi:hypothetical protein
VSGGKQLNFKVFEPYISDIYILADNADRAMDYDYVLVLGNLKEIGRLIVIKILIHEQIEIARTDPILNLEEIIDIEILPAHFETTLKQLEYLDPRESDLFIEPSQIEKLMLNAYDLISWYIKTYLNEQFISPPLLLKPRITALKLMSNLDKERKVSQAEIFIDGKKIEGIWRERNEDEYNIALEANEHYKGQVSNGIKSGKGVYRWLDGTKYDGEWYKDREHGFGIKQYANGDCYHGEWKEGLFHGQGIYEWENGERFEGSWQDNLEHGYGTKTYTDGSIQKGFWTLGELIFTEDQLKEGTPVIKQIGE